MDSEPERSFTLPNVAVNGYSAEGVAGGEPGKDKFGDAANDAAFFEILGRLPGGKKLAHLSMSDLDAVLLHGDYDDFRLLRHTVRAYADRLACVILRYLDWDYWSGTERVVIGGGLSATEIGRRVIAAVNRKVQRQRAGLRVNRIHQDSDEAGLIGAVHLFGPADLADAAALLAVDIGGSKVRTGLLAIAPSGRAGLPTARVFDKSVWKHAKAKPSRKKMVQHIVDGLDRLTEVADQAGLRLAPMVAIGCPGIIDPGGWIHRGADNLPGDWSDPDFRIGEAVAGALPNIAGERPRVFLHNDAVVQGLSELPHMQDVARWGIFTVGTGLGNAHFTNRRQPRAAGG